MQRAPRRRGPGLPLATVVLALLSVSTVRAPSTPDPIAPGWPPGFVRWRDSWARDGVELAAGRVDPPPASTTLVEQIPLPPSPRTPIPDGGVPHSAGTARDLPSVPAALLAAYRAAVAGAPAGCHLPVSLLAAIGQVESGSLAGRSIDAHHRAVPGVFGPVLSGGGYAAIHDSDGGALDGDPRWDRAVGPMQFIPGTWRAFGRDGDADGARDPQNVYDAAASAATYLCLGGRDLRAAADLQSAVLSYNHSTAYVDLVLSWQLRMAGGVAERLGTGRSTDPATPLPSRPILPMVVAAAAVPPPLVLVVPVPVRPAPGPTVVPPPPAPRSAPAPVPALRPAAPEPVTAPGAATGPVAAEVDPPADPAMMPVMTPIAVTLPPDPSAVVTPTPDPPAVVNPTPNPDPPVVTGTPTPEATVVVTPTSDPTPTAVVTPTPTPTLTPTGVVTQTPAPTTVVTPTPTPTTVVTPT
ncbi:MAG: lytic murein transglycosylase, partial [Actinomycetota bacterium]